MPRAIHAALALAAAVLPLAASAVSIGDGKLTLNGNGSWAYQRTHQNLYYADSDGDYDTAMFDLVLSARPTEDVVVSTQLGFDQEEVELEWAFAEWRYSDALRFRVGKVQQPLGNYMELQYVGTARPFFTLPTSVYGPTELGATAYFGLGATGEVLFDGGWGLQYDAYGGAIELPVYEPFEVLEPGYVPPAGGEPLETEEELVENIVGGRLSVSSPWGVTLRASAFTGGTERSGDETFSFAVFGLSALYRGERLWVSAEAFQSGEPGHETHRVGYGEVAFFVTEKVQLAARYELARTSLEEFDGSSPLLRHDEAALGVNYWFSPQLVLKGSVHRAEGLRFAAPEEGATDAGDSTLLFVAGAQFTF
jgi:hypothetical protein